LNLYFDFHILPCQCSRSIMTTAAEASITITDNPPASKSLAEQPVSDSKEQEVPSTVPTSECPMDQDTECKTDHATPSSESNQVHESQLLADGIKLLKADKFEEAVPLLSDALELIQKKGIAIDIKAVPYYMAYGEGLLRLVQSCNDLFAAPAPEQPEEDENEDDDIDNPPMITDATESSPDPGPPMIIDATETSTSTSEPAPEPASEQSAPNGKDEASPSPPKDSTDTPLTSKPAVDTSMDREIAWETFEYARTIMEDHLAITANSTDWQCVKKLAECHAFLGEICIEDERNDAALVEFTKALELQDRCAEGVVGARERACNHFFACLAAQFSEKETEALTHCEVALKALSQRICELMTKLGCDEECKETQEVLDVGAKCVEGLSSEAAQSEDGKELSGLLSVAGDLTAKLEEVQGVIKFKAENPQPEATTNSNAAVDLMASADPLSALINGLVSKCGIDQSEVARMDTQIKDEEEKKKEKGVTTIGFGTEKVEEDEEVHEIMVVKKKRRKRKLEETDMAKEVVEETTGKKMKLNTGDAMVVDTKKTDVKKVEEAGKIKEVENV